MPENYDDFDRQDDFDGRDDRGLAKAKSAVAGPAIGLIIVGVISLLVGLYNFSTMGGFKTNWDNQWDAEAQKIDGNAAMADAQKKSTKEMYAKIRDAGGAIGDAIPVIATIQAVIGLMGLFGGLQMRKLKSRGLCMSASILSMIPCVSGCCLLGLPFGIWAIIVLGRPEVKAGFAAVARGDR